MLQVLRVCSKFTQETLSAQSDGELVMSVLSALVPWQCIAMAGSLALKQAVVWDKRGKISAHCLELSCEPEELLAAQGDFKPGNRCGRRDGICMLVPATHVSAVEQVSGQVS